MSRPQPYRLDWSPVGSIEEVNDALSQIVSNTDEMFQILFEDLATDATASNASSSSSASSGIDTVVNDTNVTGSIAGTTLTLGWTGTLAVARGGTGSGTASGARTSLGLAIGTDVQAWDADLDGLAAVAANGMIARTAAGTFAARTITAGTGVSITNGDGVSGNPTVAIAGANTVTVLKKTADETVNNSNTLQDDDHLFFTAAANTTYAVELFLVMTANSVASDWKFQFSLPAGASIVWGAEFYGGGTNRWAPPVAANSPVALDTGVIALGSQNNIHGAHLMGVITIAATGGSVKLQWAQNTATVVDSILKAGSTMVVY
jgi:hypothetical protein